MKSSIAILDKDKVTPTPDGAIDHITCNQILGSMEKASLLSLSLHGLLHGSDDSNMARLAWLLYLEVSSSAELLGARLGVEVVTE